MNSMHWSTLIDSLDRMLELSGPRSEILNEWDSADYIAYCASLRESARGDEHLRAASWMAFEWLPIVRIIDELLASKK